MIRLGALLREHGDVIEADLLFRGVDIEDMGTAKLTYPRLLVLIEHLPRDSAFKRRLAGEFADWSIDNEQRAQQLDALHDANWQRGQNPRARRPERAWRPTDPSKQRETERRLTEYLAYLDARKEVGDG